jgi:hypothetical protein
MDRQVLGVLAPDLVNSNAGSPHRFGQPVAEIAPAKLTRSICA